ncbi:MAG TPA: type II toxin-antitoxin system VapC family toxin [Terriglobales bacterium]|nr:type II toxin-antitoxin system VapC family toxin [Terriglobales bacterium]
MFFDTSALVKRYVPEPESAVVAMQFEHGRGAVSRLAEVEVVSAICRRFREGDLDENQRDRLFETLDQDLEVTRVIEVLPGVVARARELLGRHTLRASDAIQLASALNLQRELNSPVRFVCFDQRLAAAAAREGLIVAGTGA